MTAFRGLHAGLLRIQRVSLERLVEVTRKASRENMLQDDNAGGKVEDSEELEGLHEGTNAGANGWYWI